MEEATDRDSDRVEPTASSAERFGILAVRVVALPFLIVAVVLWGAIMAIAALARVIAVVVDASIGALQSLRRPEIPGASAAPEPRPSAANPGPIVRRSLRAKPR